MQHSHVKSTIAIDPIKSALTKAELLAVKGQRADAISCLREALAEYPDNDELKEKLAKVEAMPEQTGEESAGGGTGKILLVVGILIVAMVVLYSVVL